MTTSQSVVQTPQNVTITPSNVITRQNIIETMQNTALTSYNFTGDSSGLLKAAMDIAQVQPKTQTFIIIGNKIFQLVSHVQRQEVIKQHVPQQPDVQEVVSDPATSAKSFSIPEGYRKTKLENTLEKITPVPEKDQKAGKRLFCQICMMNKIETGYTKRFDLTKHLTRCGKEGVEKPFKCTGYGTCEKSFARVENL